MGCLGFLYEGFTIILPGFLIFIGITTLIFSIAMGNKEYPIWPGLIAMLLGSGWLILGLWIRRKLEK